MTNYNSILGYIFLKILETKNFIPKNNKPMMNIGDNNHIIVNTDICFHE